MQTHQTSPKKTHHSHQGCSQHTHAHFWVENPWNKCHRMLQRSILYNLLPFWGLHFYIFLYIFTTRDSHKISKTAAVRFLSPQRARYCQMLRASAGNVLLKSCRRPYWAAYCLRRKGSNWVFPGFRSGEQRRGKVKIRRRLVTHPGDLLRYKLLFPCPFQQRVKGGPHEIKRPVRVSFQWTLLVLMQKSTKVGPKPLVWALFGKL